MITLGYMRYNRWNEVKSHFTIVPLYIFIIEIHHKERENNEAKGQFKCSLKIWHFQHMTQK